MEQKDIFFNKIKRAVDFSKTTHKHWDLYSSILKLDEEYGELSEVILVVGKQLIHKTLKEKALGEIADNIIQASCIASYNHDIDFYLNEIKKNNFVQFSSLIHQLNSQHTNLKDALYFYHKKYRTLKEILISNVDMDSLEAYKQSLYVLLIIGVILTAMEDDLTIKDLTLEYCDKSVSILIDQMEFKLNKWSNIHTKFTEV